MGNKVKAIPDGYHSITPGFGVPGCEKAIEWYKKVFGAEVRMLFKTPDGRVAHCEMVIGDSTMMFGEPQDRPAYNLHAMLYVDDSDAVVKRAVEAGATLKEPVSTKFYGDRGGRVTDPFGNDWFIATHVEDVSPEEMQKRMAAMTPAG